MSVEPRPRDIREQALRRAREVLAQVRVPEGAALVATGSFARGEMTPYSDLDLVLLHEGDPPPEAEQCWYAIWDAKFRLDYSIRTPEDCIAVMHSDMTAGLALLDMVFVAGEEALFTRTRAQLLQAWRAGLRRNFSAVIDAAIARWRRSGSVVTMTRPDVKHGRGALRDIELVRALALGNLCDAPDLRQERTLLLDTRTLLHLEARRARDVVDPEFAMDIALRLGFSDRYELARALADAAHNVDTSVTAALRTARAVVSSGRRHSRKPLDLDVVDVGGEVRLSRSPNLDDAGLVLRVAAASARTGLPISESVWRVLHEVPALPTPWPKAAVNDFFAVLVSDAFVAAELDAHGLWSPLVPEWERIRGLLPRERTHVHTIDRHSLATVAGCAVVRVPRPDLLLLAALYHDIGKGFGRPHSRYGAELVARQAQRMGLDVRDRGCVQTLVQEHTTLLRLATTRDPAAEDTVDALLDALRYDLLTVELLEVLTEADARATGPNVWMSRTAAVAELGRRARQRLTRLEPRKPMVAASGDIAVLAGPRVRWQGSYIRESIRVLAVFAARGWKIEAARLVDDSRSGGTCRAEFDVRVGFEGIEGFEQMYKSGVYCAVSPPAPAATATYWFGNTLEVRTVDRPGVLSALLAVLPDLTWATLDTPGATCIARFHLHAGFDRAAVERDVDKVLEQGDPRTAATLRVGGDDIRC